MQLPLSSLNQHSTNCPKLIKSIFTEGLGDDKALKQDFIMLALFYKSKKTVQM